jgi:hypothetical protein
MRTDATTTMKATPIKAKLSVVLGSAALPGIIIVITKKIEMLINSENQIIKIIR